MLPVLVPELSYNDLEVRKGDEAQRVYLEFLGIREPAKDRESLKQGLLEYCKLDTFAMVEIYRVLRETVN